MAKRLREVLEVFRVDELVRRSEVSKRTISRVLRGEHVKLPTLIALAEAAGVSRDWFLDGVGENTLIADLPGHDPALHKRLQDMGKATETARQTTGYRPGLRLGGAIDPMALALALRMCARAWIDQPLPPDFAGEHRAWLDRAIELAAYYDGLAEQMERGAPEDEDDGHKL